MNTCKNWKKNWNKTTWNGTWQGSEMPEEKRTIFHNYPKWPPAVPLWGQQWTSRCRFPRKQKMERQHNKSILWEFQSSRTIVVRVTDRYQLKIVQVYAPTTSHSDEETDNFYNTIDKILEKQKHYTIAIGNLMRKLEDKQIHQKGWQNASAWSSEMKEETNHCLILYRLLILPDLSSKMRPCGGKRCTEEE